MAKDKKTPRRNTLGAAPEKAVLKGNEGSEKAQKTAARLAGVQTLYQMQLNDQDAKSALKDFIEHRIGFKLDDDVFVPADKELLTEIVMGVNERLADINEIVKKALAEGNKSDVEILLKSILQAGAYELIANNKVDAGIIINDYLNVTTGFYEGSETKIINAVLDKIAKTVRA